MSEEDQRFRQAALELNKMRTDQQRLRQIKKLFSKLETCAPFEPGYLDKYLDKHIDDIEPKVQELAKAQRSRTLEKKRRKRESKQSERQIEKLSQMKLG